MQQKFIDCSSPSLPPKLKFRNTNLSLYHWGLDYQLPPSHTMPPVIRDHYLMQFCCRGRGVFYVDKKPYPMSAGSCLVTFPGCALAEVADDEDPWGLYWLGLHSSQLDYYFEHMGITKKNPTFTWQNNDLVQLCLDRVIATGKPFYDHMEIFSPPNPSERIAQVGMELERLGAVYTLLAEFLRQASAAPFPPLISKGSEDYVHQAVAYMERNFRQQLKVADIACYVGLTRSYLFTLFKQTLHQSPQEFLTKLRIEKACEFLRNPEVAITNIADSVGLTASALHRFFKKYKGCTPREYRKMLKQSADAEKSPR